MAKETVISHYDVVTACTGTLERKKKEQKENRHWNMVCMKGSFI